MISDHPVPKLLPASPARIRRYRIAAAVALTLGIIGAGLVYWRGARTPDYSDDPSMLGFNRPAERQLGMLYGKQGQLIEDLDQSLRRPGTQAALILATASVVSFGCFYFSRILEADTKTEPDANPFNN